MTKITRKAAAKFYADVFAICHSNDRKAGRRFCPEKSNHPISSRFDVDTRFGVLTVDVSLPEWIPALGFSVHMRFEGRPRIYPEPNGMFYDSFTGKWGIYGDADFLLAELSARLAWAQGVDAPLRNEVQEVLSL